LHELTYNGLAINLSRLSKSFAAVLLKKGSRQGARSGQPMHYQRKDTRRDNFPKDQAPGILQESNWSGRFGNQKSALRAAVSVI
jgi:hypothetical protein